MDYSPPGSSAHGISQAKILESATILFSRGSSQPRDRTHVSWAFPEPLGNRRSDSVTIMLHGLPWWLSGQESACNTGARGDTDSIPGSGRSPGGKHGNLLRYSCLENPTDREAWWATVHRVTRSDLAWMRTHLYGTFLITDHLLQAALSEYSIHHIAEQHALRCSFLQTPLTCITSCNSLILLAGLSFLLSPPGYL